MSSVGILSVKDFDRIRKLADRGKNNIATKGAKGEANRLNSKSQLASYSKEKKEIIDSQSKTLTSSDSKHLTSHISYLSPMSKTSLSTSKKKAYNEGSPVASSPENKSNQKKHRILPPSLIHNRNKNNKFSKIPFRKVQTFDEEESTKYKTKKSSKYSQKYDQEDDNYIDHDDKLEKENDQIIDKEEANLDNIKDNSNDNNNYKDEFNKSISELQTQKNMLNQIEQLNTIPYNKESDFFINSNNDDNEKINSNCRNKILNLQMQIDSLRERRKRELAVFQDKAIKQQQNYNNESGQNLINDDDESIIELKNELLKYEKY